MKTFIGIVLVLILAAGGYYWYTSNNEAAVPNTNNGSDTVGTETYVSNEYGIAFEYPDTYVLSENNGSKGGVEMHTITLIDADDAANIPQNGEGPTAITVQVIGTDDELEAWIRDDSTSNFNLSTDGVLTPTAVDGTAAFAYTWDGLYRGNSIALSHQEQIIILSVTMLSPSDQIVSDFAGVVASMQLN